MVYWRLFVNDRLNPHGGGGHWKKVLKYEFDLIQLQEFIQGEAERRFPNGYETQKLKATIHTVSGRSKRRHIDLAGWDEETFDEKVMTVLDTEQANFKTSNMILTIEFRVKVDFKKRKAAVMPAMPSSLPLSSSPPAGTDEAEGEETLRGSRKKQKSRGEIQLE